MRAFRLYYKKVGDVDYNIIEALNYNYYTLEKSSFNGAETYEGRIHVLRDMGGIENKTAFTEFQITLPARGNKLNFYTFLRFYRYSNSL